jgi:molybdenum cofactor synthesis domain-containing protein
MISVDKAQEIISNFANVLIKTIEKETINSLNYISSEKVTSNINFPSRRLSMRDGYGWNTEWNTQKCKLLNNKITPDIKSFTNQIKEGETLYITTGGFVPEIFNTVIMVEDVIVEDGFVIPNTNNHYKPNQYLRLIGSDVKEGDLLLDALKHINLVDIAILSSCKVKKIGVYRKPNVIVFSNGNELVSLLMAPEHQSDECIVDTNSDMITNLVKKDYLHDSILNLGVIRDDPKELASVINVKDADVIIGSGGSSVGEFDFTRRVLVENNYTIHISKVNMMPGKPFIFATREYDGKYFFGLPGNPVASFVCLNLFVKLFLSKICGMNSTDKLIKLELGYDTKSSALDGRIEYQRVKVTPDTRVALSTGNQASSRLLSLQEADALVIIESGKEYKKGSIVKGILL